MNAHSQAVNRVRGQIYACIAIGLCMALTPCSVMLLMLALMHRYYAYMQGIQNNTLVDYYVQATDVYGNIKKTDIYHVYLGA